MATVPKSDRTTIITLASAIAGPFELEFRLFDDDALAVFVNDLPRTDFTITSSYTDGYDDNATITFDAALSSGDVVRIHGDITPGRAADYQDGPGLTAKLNIEFARLWSAVSDMKRDTNRSAKFFQTVSPIALTAGASLAVNDAADGIEMGPTSDEISSAQGYATTASTKATEAAASAVEAAAYDGPKVDTFPELADITPAMLAVGGLIRCIELNAVYQRVETGEHLDYSGSGGVKLKNMPGANGFTDKAFGAVGDGVTDDTAALRAMVTAMINDERDGNLTAGCTYRVTGEIDVPKVHSGVIRKFIELNGNGATIDADGSNFTIFGYTKVLAGALDITNYFIRFKNITFTATAGTNIKGIRWGGFVSSEFSDLFFHFVDYPFWQEEGDPRETPDYVQSPVVRRCYSNNHKRFMTASVIYNGDIEDNIIDVGVEAIHINNGAAAQSFYQLGIRRNVIQTHSGQAVVLGGGQALDYSNNYHENNAYDVLLAGSNIVSDGAVDAEVGDGVFWEYIAAGTGWTASADYPTSGVYRTNAGKLYRLVGIGQGGSTAPVHTSGTVTDGGVDWEYISTIDGVWTTGSAYTKGNTVTNSSKIYRAATTGTAGATAPTHTGGTVVNYGGSMRDNFSQPKGTLAAGYRAFIEVGGNPEYGFSFGGNVAQGGANYCFGGDLNGYFNVISCRDALSKERLYDADTRPDNEKLIFNDGTRFGVVSGTDGGVILNPAARGYEVTHAELDWYDSTDDKRVPVVHGVAESTPPGFGPTGAFPPSTYSSIYAQKGWAQGSILWNNTLNAGEALGWVCVVSGRPGTWVPFGGVQTADAYSPSNYTPNRTLDAGTATTGTIANVLATVIADLRTSGVLK